MKDEKLIYVRLEKDEAVQSKRDITMKIKVKWYETIMIQWLSVQILNCYNGFPITSDSTDYIENLFFHAVKFLIAMIFLSIPLFILYNGLKKEI